MNHDSLIRDVDTLRQATVAMENRYKKRDDKLMNSYSRHSIFAERRQQDKHGSRHSILNPVRFEEDVNHAMIHENIEAIKCLVERMEETTTFTKVIGYIVKIGAAIIIVPMFLNFLF